MKSNRIQMQDLARIILERAMGRLIFVYGAQESGIIMYRLLRYYGIEVSFFVDRKWKLLPEVCRLPVYGVESLNFTKHFPVINESSDLRTIESIKLDLHGAGYPPNDFFYWGDDVDFDVELNGIVLGKGSPLLDLYLRPTASKLLKSVGRYASVNPTVNIAYNHFMGLSTSFRVPVDDIRYQKYTIANRIEIGHDAYIGANVFINQSKVKTIGNGAIVGSGTVVLEDVPPYAFMVGVPGRIKKYRFTHEQISVLERVQWWNWDDETMKENGDCFVNPLLFFERFG